MSYSSIPSVIMIKKQGSAWYHLERLFPHTYRPCYPIIMPFAALIPAAKPFLGEGGTTPPAGEILNGSSSFQLKWLTRSAFPHQKPGFTLHLSQRLKTILELIKINPGLEKGSFHLGGNFPSALFWKIAQH